MRVAASMLVASLLATGAFAQNCITTAAGDGCGITLTVGFTPNGQGGGHILDVAIDGLVTPLPNINVMIFGQTNFNWQLPGPNPLCVLHTEMLWGHIINPDATGHYDWQRSWPGWALGHYYIQAGRLVNNNGELEFHSSNCIRAECQ